MVLCTLALLRRIFKQRSAEKLYESVEWLNLWWSVHPPKFGRERFESVLAHALNNELQPSGHTLGSVQVRTYIVLLKNMRMLIPSLIGGVVCSVCFCAFFFVLFLLMPSVWLDLYL